MALGASRLLALGARRRRRRRGAAAKAPAQYGVQQQRRPEQDCEAGRLHEQPRHAQVPDGPQPQRRCARGTRPFVEMWCLRVPAGSLLTCGGPAGCSLSAACRKAGAGASGNPRSRAVTHPDSAGLRVCMAGQPSPPTAQGPHRATARWRRRPGARRAAPRPAARAGARSPRAPGRTRWPACAPGPPAAAEAVSSHRCDGCRRPAGHSARRAASIARPCSEQALKKTRHAL